MTASPSEITSRTCSELEIRLDLINCGLVSNIGTGDIVLGGAFDVLSLNSVTDNSATQFVITLEGEIDGTDEGTITVDQGALNIDYNLTATVAVHEKEIDYIIIYGEDFINIPEGDNETESYTATVHDQFGDVIEDESVEWSLEEPVIGVSIDNNSGVATVYSGAEEGSFTVVATSDPNGDIEGTLDVDLLPAPSDPTLCGTNSTFTEDRQNDEVVVTAKDQYDEPINDLDTDKSKWTVEEKEGGAQQQTNLDIEQILSDENSNIYTIEVENIQNNGDVGHVVYDEIEIRND